MVFASLLATGAATGSFSGELRDLGSRSPEGPRDPSAHTALNGAPRDGGSDAKGSGPHTQAERSGKVEDAADALVSRSGDRWSAAYSAREYEGLQQALDGTYVGVGISVRQVRTEARNRRHGRGPAVEVDRVQPGSPAARAGVRTGDRLRTVDGAQVTGMPVTDVVTMLRGSEPGSPAAAEPGTQVALDLGRAEGEGRTEWHTTLRRARLSTESVSVDRLGDGVSRIKVSSFTRGSGERVREAVEREVPPGAGILLDLRGNAGGLVDEAVTSASAFLDGGLVATYDDKGTQRALYAERDERGERAGRAGPGRRTARPVVVLVDGGTMSAAELLTGALQDRGRAVVVGSRTFGKGSVQMPSRQKDGSVAEMTVGHYATPSGRQVEGEGLTPDLPVDSREGATERARTVLSGLEARS